MAGTTTPLVLLAEDDQDDVFLVKQAAARSGVEFEIEDVRDGVELMRALRRTDEYRDARRPDLVLLDLRMPRLSGHEVLVEIKSDPELAAIPVVVMSTSGAAADIDRAYQSGASGYITKPPSFAGLVEAISGLGRYWFETVTRPGMNR